MKSRQAVLRRAEAHLSAVSPRWAALVRRAGPCRLEVPVRVSTFHALVNAICHQQLHGAAAQAIVRRLKVGLGGGRWPGVDDVQGASLEALRACGLSRAKALALKDLAARVESGQVAPAHRLRRLSDEDIINRLTQVRGVGRWTVEMLLVFRLGRLDVWPVNDFGVRKGWAVLYGERVLPTARALEALGEAFRPYRSVAAWYLWRSADGEGS